MQIIRKFYDSPAAMPPMATVNAYKDVSNRVIYVRASTEDVDRSGEVVVQSGINLSNFRRASSPVLLNHSAQQPVARCIDIGLVNGNLEAAFKFPDPGKLPFSDAIFAAVMEGLIGAVSIGFMPVETAPMDKGNAARGPQRYLKSDLMEISLTPTPCNPAAVVLRTGLTPQGARKMVAESMRAGIQEEITRAKLMREIEVMKLVMGV